MRDGTFEAMRPYLYRRRPQHLQPDRVTGGGDVAGGRSGDGRGAGGADPFYLRVEPWLYKGRLDPTQEAQNIGAHLAGGLGVADGGEQFRRQGCVQVDIHHEISGEVGQNATVGRVPGVDQTTSVMVAGAAEDAA